MILVIGQMATMVLIGLWWQWARPGGWQAAQARGALTTLVYYVLLPALVLAVLWRAPLGADSLRIAGLAALGVLASMGLMAVLARFMRLTRGQTGALLLAASFPNATYLGLPVLESLFGDFGRAVAVQYDLFACTPLLLSLGIAIAVYYGTPGEGQEGSPPWWVGLFKIPALWAAVIAAGLNLSGVPLPDVLGGILDRLGAGVVPLMLIALGMGLRLDALQPAALARVSPVLVIQLALAPALVWGAGLMLGLSPPLLTAVVLEAGMPVMVLGLVLCDRHGLDTGLYAAAATLSTLLSLLTLPFWHGMVGA
ncbi:MAG TPA: AEC family transporter [Chromatiales bacterium]|nr:AEC family transporter [Chromatiales bacterium]